MQHPTSKIPQHLDNALRVLTTVRDELRRQGMKKPDATQLIKSRVEKLVPHHSDVIAIRFAFLVKQQGLDKASALLRSGI